MCILAIEDKTGSDFVMERERNAQRDRRERCGEKKERATVGAEGEKGRYGRNYFGVLSAKPQI